MNGIKIRPINIFSSELQAFLQAQADGQFLIQRELSAENPFFLHARVQAFVAEKEGKPVGRILASLDHNLQHPFQHQSTIGHFGYFDCIEDQAVAQALIKSAEDWLLAQGVIEIHGPIQLSVFNSYRFMMDGFETVPFLGEPRNPAYYLSFFQALHYHPKALWHSWELNEQMISQLMGEFQEKIQQGADLNLQIVPADLENFEEEARQLFPVAMETFSQNYGFSRIPFEEFLFMFAKLRQILTPESYLKLINRQGDIVGFAYGHPNPFSTAQMVAHTMGLLPAFRRGVLSYQLALSFFEMSLRTGFTSILAALTVEGRTFFDHLTRPTRTYGILAKKLCK